MADRMHAARTYTCLDPPAGPVVCPVMELDGSVPIVTGANHGIGAATAARPDDVADVICFLCSDRTCWLTGQTLFVRGGWRVW